MPSHEFTVGLAPLRRKRAATKLVAGVLEKWEFEELEDPIELEELEEVVVTEGREKMAGSSLETNWHRTT